ncbi:MAG: UDP-glucose/GDP-mannose dehydrogenase family protein [Clostridiales bacterium]|nr:UDP-glucose/GDP-mannose dehydrogenase family protein [Clostridiales bacterium]
MKYKIAIAGTGYVGLVSGVGFAHIGHEVTCVDIDEEKVLRMRQGISPIYEAGLEELMEENKDRLFYTTDYVLAYKDADLIFIGVGTPERNDGSANLAYVFQVAEQIAKSVEKDCLVVVKSTVPIGTNDKIEAFIQEKKAHPVRIEVASNPEFLAQGTAVRDTLQASRIVIGVQSKWAENILREVYKGFEGIPVVVTDRRSAEMIKYAANDFLALKISYINDIANLCEIVGADVQDVAYGMGFDSRIGNKFLNAGIGYGGSCFPKDTKALHWLGNFYNYELKTVKASIEVNEQQKYKLLKKARGYFATLKDIKVAVLGLTFKPGTDDLRDAASLTNIPLLLEEGAKVTVYDPVGMENFKKQDMKGITYAKSATDALKDAELCLILTEWAEMKELKPSDFIKHMKTPIVLDGRNCFPLDQMEGQGIIYESVGRRTIK